MMMWRGIAFILSGIVCFGLDYSLCFAQSATAGSGKVPQDLVGADTSQVSRPVLPLQLSQASPLQSSRGIASSSDSSLDVSSDVSTGSDSGVRIAPYGDWFYKCRDVLAAKPGAVSAHAANSNITSSNVTNPKTTGSNLANSNASGSERSGLKGGVEQSGQQKSGAGNSVGGKSIDGKPIDGKSIDGKIVSQCEIIQVQQVKEDDRSVNVLTLAIAQTAPEKKGGKAGLLLTAVAPLNLYLDDGLSFSISGKSLLSMKYRSCNQTGCWAQARLGDAVLSSFKKASVGEAHFRIVTGQRVNVKFSLKGLSEALAILERENLKK